MNNNLHMLGIHSQSTCWKFCYFSSTRYSLVPTYHTGGYGNQTSARAVWSPHTIQEGMGTKLVQGQFGPHIPYRRVWEPN